MQIDIGSFETMNPGDSTICIWIGIFLNTRDKNQNKGCLFVEICRIFTSLIWSGGISVTTQIQVIKWFYLQKTLISTSRAASRYLQVCRSLRRREKVMKDVSSKEQSESESSAGWSETRQNSLWKKKERKHTPRGNEGWKRRRKKQCKMYAECWVENEADRKRERRRGCTK